MSAPENPPAFHPQLGVTLRDYFACEALNGILLAHGQVGQEAQNNPAKAAGWAYQQADAMLAERSKKPNTP